MKLASIKKIAPSSNIPKPANSLVNKPTAIKKTETVTSTKN